MYYCQCKCARQVTQAGVMLIADFDLLWDIFDFKPDYYDFSRGEVLDEFAQNYKMLFGATYLVWYEYLPESVKETRKGAKR